MKFGFFKSKTYYERQRVKRFLSPARGGTKGSYLILALGLVVLLAYANSRIYKKSNKEDLGLLRKEALEEQMENQKLAHLKEYLATDVYLERQAREKFKMQKPGEKVMMIEQNKLTTKEQNSSRESLPNILKWWYYLVSN